MGERYWEVKVWDLDNEGDASIPNLSRFFDMCWVVVDLEENILDESESIFLTGDENRFILKLFPKVFSFLICNVNLIIWWIRFMDIFNVYFYVIIIML